jgi:hypothetical protein
MEVFEVVIAMLLSRAALAVVARRIGAPYPALEHGPVDPALGPALYSCRIASSGSIAAARRAGSQQASTAAVSKATVASASAPGSAALTPNRTVVSA